MNTIFKFPKENILESVVPFYLIIKFSGYASFTVRGDIRDGRIGTSLLDIAQFITFLTLCTIIFYYTLFTNIGIAHSIILNLAKKFTALAGLSIAVIFSVTNFVRRKTVWRIFVRLYKLDQKMEALGCRIDNHDYFKKICFLGIGGSVFLQIIIIWSFYNFQLHMSIIHLALLYFPNGNFGLLMIIFNMHLYAIYDRFKQFNKCFSVQFNESGGGEEATGLSRDMRFETKAIKFIRNSDNELKQIVSEFAIVHSKLNDIVEIINSVYSPQVLLATALTFIYYLFTIFSGYRTWTHFHEDDNDITLALNNLFWTFYYMSFVLSIMALGSAATRQGNYTVVLVQRAINSSSNPQIVKRLRLFLMQLIHREPIFTCHLFPFDWTLLYSVIGASTTYLVILIQFENTVNQSRPLSPLSTIPDQFSNRTEF